MPDTLLASGTESMPPDSVLLHDPAVNSYGPVNGHSLIRVLWTAEDAATVLAGVTALKLETKRTASGDDADDCISGTCDYVIVPSIWSVYGTLGDGTCSDEIINGDEVGIDCGGSCANACPPTCSDEIMNGDEVGVDCGGSCGDACPPTC